VSEEVQLLCQVEKGGEGRKNNRKGVKKLIDYFWVNREKLLSGTSGGKQSFERKKTGQWEIKERNNEQRKARGVERRT